MLVKEPYGYNMIKTMETVAWDESFFYEEGWLRVYYNHLEEVVNIKILNPYEGHAYVEGLDVSNTRQRAKLTDMINGFELESIINNRDINLHFDRNDEYLLKSYIDGLNDSDKDELLYTLIREYGGNKTIEEES